MSASTLGELTSSRRLASTPERQAGVSCCSDANRIATIVASERGRAKLGLLVRSLLSKRIRRLNLGRRLVILVDEVIEVEGVNAAVVVANQMIVVKIEGVGIREDPVLKESTICPSGIRKVEIACEAVVIKSVIAKIWEKAEVVSVQGRCSSD
jgi:uncharacterized protein (DUF2126 family)